MRKIPFFILMISLLSYNFGKGQRSINSEDSGVNMATQNSVSFFDFFQQFMWDQAFQESRIIYPIQVNNKEVKTPKEWKYMPFYTQQSSMPVLASDTIHALDRGVDLAKTEMYIVDFNTQNVECFDFENIKNNWYLKKVSKVRVQQLPDFEFVDFIMKFSKDPAFQMQNISFPLLESFADPEIDYERSDKTIKHGEWKYTKLTEEINPLMILSNLQTKNKYRNILIRGVESGIWVRYIFEKINGGWKLIKLEDFTV